MCDLFVGGRRLEGGFLGTLGARKGFGNRYWALGALIARVSVERADLYSCVMTDRERRAIVGCGVVGSGMVVGGLGAFEGHIDGGGRGHCFLLVSRGILGEDGDSSDIKSMGRRLYWREG